MLKIENVDVICWGPPIGITWETFRKYSQKIQGVL